MTPCNINLVRWPAFRVGKREEGAETMIGELDDLMGTEDADECIIYDPMFPFPLPHVDGMRRKHNVTDLIEMTAHFLESSTAMLR
jgi:hypothetical protein